MVNPLDLMQQVIDQLAENPENKILLFGGGKKEIELLDSLSNGKENVVVVAGKLQFQQELQLISNLDIMFINEYRLQRYIKIRIPQKKKVFFFIIFPPKVEIKEKT